MRLPFLLITITLCVNSISAQDIEVKKFEPMVKDQTAALNPRKDINGIVCGLVKVQLKEPGAEFEGNVMGDVQFTGNEYLVYLPNGTKRLGIKHPDYLPTTIVFADYGTKKIASSTTYELKVKTNKKQAKVDNSKKGMAVFNIKPSNAMLLIDGQIADGSGGAYTLSLPYGTHYYTVKLKDFSINNQMFLVSHDIRTINVDLTHYFAWINISSSTNDADIFINNSLMSSGSWEGYLPPSAYMIELRKDGYHSLSKTINLYESDSLFLNLPEMNVIGGKLRVKYLPNSSSVYVDGKYIGKTPLEYDGISEGSHRVEISCENYESHTDEIIMLVDQTQLLEGQLQLTDIGYLLTRANEGDVECQWRLGNIYWGNDRGGFTRKDLPYAPNHPCPRLEQDLDKAILWLEKVAATKYDYKKDRSDFPLFAKESLSRCYFLKKDFQKSFYWAEMSNDRRMKILCYYYGLGVQKDKKKCAQLILKSEWDVKQLHLDEIGLRKYEMGDNNDSVLIESIQKLFEYIDRELWEIARRM